MTSSYGQTDRTARIFAIAPTTRRTGPLSGPVLSLWAGKDSNLRRQCRQVYSLLPLAARAPTHMFANFNRIAQDPPLTTSKRLQALRFGYAYI